MGRRTEAWSGSGLRGWRSGGAARGGGRKRGRGSGGGERGGGGGAGGRGAVPGVGGAVTAGRVSKGAPGPEVTDQPVGEISTYWPTGLARSMRILPSVVEAVRNPTWTGAPGVRSASDSRCWRMARNWWEVGMVSNWQ